MKKSAHTLEKSQRLEQYISSGNSSADPVLDMAIEKLLAREITRMFELKGSLAGQLETFERQFFLI